MTSFRTLTWFGILTLLLTAMACGESESADQTPTPFFTVVDSNGNEVTFEQPPERIVALDSAVVEILFAIGEGERVVGTHYFVAYPPEAADIPRVGSAFNMNIDATVALEPDLVFIFSDTFLQDLQRAGLKVLFIKSLSDDFRQIADNIRMWGRITGSPDAAEAVASEFEARLAKIEAAMAKQPGGPSVFQDEGDLWTPGPDTLIGEVLDLLKLANIAHDVSGYAQLSPEVIVDRNPQIIIASYGDAISDKPAFKDVSAVKNNRIYVPRSDALSVAGPRYIDGIEELARWVYPDLFK
jgi:iron complex transport system substrate-binding protein